ncbi:hypothetical protein Q5424_10705 [Conexibacter sp. JD483]|uniref:hypothetical protein n=1 Tax=unclassified Conexibacter TaxID=2627773 RepID=UPI002721F12E|nr:MULTISPECIES: hypothetical protein [unclassified Conexibacter]MDO8187514.1 hypothetical protein [Conexibacter sp. CPCC 205706]MDO8199243.1 hypothetical protein [Conexibacter sp. CPCC 205762]MDR9369552.1 hypothetical protein [Conexibacter sp. JD483]
MKRILLGVVALVCALGVVTTTASAKIYEIGASTTAAAPSCPENCRVVTKTTALQVSTGGKAYPITVPTAGRVVALSLQLGSLTVSQVRRLNATYGGTPRVQLTVLSQDSRQKPKRLYTAKAQSEVFRVTDYLGTTAQFPLERSLEVAKGDFLALTVPTWAPVLSVNLDDANSWRASRASRCNDEQIFITQTAQLILDREAAYKCIYRTAKVTYTATMISTPKARKLEDESSSRDDTSRRTSTTRRTTTTTR